MAKWSGNNLAITAWSDNVITPETDGFVVGDDITYKVWIAASDVELVAQNVSYSSEHPFYRTDGKYDQNSIYALSTFSATAEGVDPDDLEPAPPVLALPADNAQDVPVSVALTWEASAHATSYDLQVSTNPTFTMLVKDETGLVETSRNLIGLLRSKVYYWRVRAANDGSTSAYSPTRSFTTIPVPDEVNVPPVFTSTPNEAATEGEVYVYDITAEDENGDAISLFAPEIASWMTFEAADNGTATLTGIPSDGDAGDYEITLSAKDTKGAQSTQTFSVTVHESVNTPPSASQDHVSTEEDVEIEIDVLANDSDSGGGALSVYVQNQPAHGAASVANDMIVYVPAPDYNGRDTLAYRIQNTLGAAASALVVIDVTPVDDAPYFPNGIAVTHPANGAEIFISSQTAIAPGTGEEPVSVEWIEAIDVDGDPVSYAWELSSTEEFSSALLRIDAGTERRLETDRAGLREILTAQGISTGSSRTFYHRVVATAAGVSVASQVQSVALIRGTTTGTDDRNQPTQFTLEQNYPNPFNPQTTISYTLAEAAFVTLTVYDVVGKEVATLVSNQQAAGKHDIAFEAGRLNSGVYAYRIEAGEYTAIKSMVLVK